MTYAMVEVSLDEFSDDDLIDELEERGYRVVEDDDYVPSDLTPEEVEYILSRFAPHHPGSMGYNIYEKLRKR